MATLTIDDAVLLKVDELAKKEEISRDDFVNRAIKLYLREKLMVDPHGHGGCMGITEEAINKEIKKYKNERRPTELSGVGRSKLEIVESLFGIIPNDGISLAELREERLSRYENTD